VQALTATTARFRAPEPDNAVVTPPAVVAPPVKLRPPKASRPPRSLGALAIAEDGSEWVDF
jgi:methyl-accepting chemotaxis protein